MQSTIWIHANQSGVSICAVRLLVVEDVTGVVVAELPSRRELVTDLFVIDTRDVAFGLTDRDVPLPNPLEARTEVVGEVAIKHDFPEVVKQAPKGRPL